MPSRRQAVAERRAEALRLRRNGASHAELAEALGYKSEQAASKDVHRALQNTVREAGRGLLELECARLDALHAVLWPLAEGGDVRAARELIRLMERRARMLAIDGRAVEADQERRADEAKGLLGAFGAAMTAAYEHLPTAER